MLSQGLDSEFIAKEWLAAYPLFEPLLPVLMTLDSPITPPSIERLNHLVDVKNYTFVQQESKSNVFEEGYEARIFLKQEILTRQNSWHDFFNALVWNRFYESKRAINQAQFHFQKTRQPSKQRLPGENMLTMFDENGAIVIATNQLYLASFASTDGMNFLGATRNASTVLESNYIWTRVI